MSGGYEHAAPDKALSAWHLQCQGISISNSKAQVVGLVKVSCCGSQHASRRQKAAAVARGTTGEPAVRLEAFRSVPLALERLCKERFPSQ